MPNPGAGAGSVFISHSTDDAQAARGICALLETRGVKCWIAPRDVPPGGAYGEEIVKAVEACDALLLVLSPGANESRAVAAEVERAFSLKRLIIPVRLADLKPSRALEFFVANSQWVDVWRGGLESNADKIVAAVRGEAPRPECPSAAGRKRGTQRLWFRLLAPAVAAAGAVAAAWWFAASRMGPARGTTPGRVPETAAEPAPTNGAGALDALRYRALVVGINEYQSHSGSGWQKLKAARGDAEAFADIIEKRYGFTVTRLFDGQATRNAIVAALDSLVDLTPRDAALIYFAGHGFYEKPLNEGYWIPCDARKTTDGNRHAKEDWLWNSMITKIVGASMARHVLVIADSCYSGSLLRGEPAASGSADVRWYSRAMAKPSRYVIASGDMEPVLDAGGRHSVFAQEIINYMQNGDKGVFSASDLGVALRQKVSELTGQMVQMGPLGVATHAGGEFVFVRKDELARWVRTGSEEQAAPGAQPAPVRIAATRDAAERQRSVQDALVLGQRGATNTAARLLAGYLSANPDDRLALAVVSHLDQDRRAKAQDRLRDLIRALEAKKTTDPAEGSDAYRDSARPRVMTCLGPEAKQAGDVEAAAALYRICLRSDLELAGRVEIVEREAIETVLQEMNLGTSSLADPKARMEIGKLLPASLLLLGDLLSNASGDRVFMRLVDTETGRVLGSFSANRKPEEDVVAVCAGLASNVTAAAARAKPLTAAVARLEGNRVHARVGRYHGAREGMVFQVVERVVADRRRPEDYREEPVGKARVEKLGDITSDLAGDWPGDIAGARSRTFWVRELIE